MTKLLWDQSGDRHFEAGIDRGVLYLPDGSGVVWNGLTGVEEDFSDDAIVSLYSDGVNYLNIPTIGDFNATLKAFTYPDEFLVCEGVVDVDGMLVDGQTPVPFGISYRSLTGNDVEGTDHGYKIHLIYNLTAVPTASTYDTLTNSGSAMEFSWQLSSVPENAPGFRPTAHLIFDTRILHALLVYDLELILYGSDTTAARIPTIPELILFAESWALLKITDNGDGTWTAEDHGEYITMTDATTFQINAANSVVIDANTYTITDTQA